MKKLFFLFFLSFLLAFASCDLDDEDSSDSLPCTDSSQFIKSDSIMFPVGTTALEIYNCLIELKGLGDFPINGTYSHTETAVLNGKEYTDTIEKKIIQVKIYKSDTEISHLFHCDFITDSDEKLPFYYQWQYHNTNAWHNNKTEGEIMISTDS